MANSSISIADALAKVTNALEFNDRRCNKLSDLISQRNATIVNKQLEIDALTRKLADALQGVN